MSVQEQNAKADKLKGTKIMCRLEGAVTGVTVVCGSRPIIVSWCVPADFFLVPAEICLRYIQWPDLILSFL